MIAEKGTEHHLWLTSWILRGQESNSWPTTPSGKSAREECRAAHGTPGGPAGIAGIDTGILARGQQRSGYGFMVFVPLTFRCREIETPLMENQVVSSLKVSGTFFPRGALSAICNGYGVQRRQGWPKASPDVR